MLSDAEITILQKLIYTIENDDIETSTFSQDEIMVLHKLTNWDDLRIFPGKPSWPFYSSDTAI